MPVRLLHQLMKYLLALSVLLFASTAFGTPARTEIESLLGYIQALEGASFIRNRASHPAAAAAAHLRLKWEKQEKEIATAEDFIRLCGSKSTTSGERYRIRFEDGTERYCDEVLFETLAATRASAVQRANTEKSLRTATVFAFGGVGVAGSPAPGEVALRELVKRDDVVPLLESVLENGTPEAKCYALAALHAVAPRAFYRHAGELRTRGPEPVRTMSGCLVGTSSNLAIIDEIEAGRYAVYIGTKPPKPPERDQSKP